MFDGEEKTKTDGKSSGRPCAGKEPGKCTW